MKDIILRELADRWNKEANYTEDQDGSESAKISNAMMTGERKQLKECAEELLTLIDILGDDKSSPGTGSIGRRKGNL